MTARLKQIQPTIEPQRQHFGEDVTAGLTHTKKYISSKYFYDSRGSQLFTAITQHPDYYLTCCELEILERYKACLSSVFSNKAFNLIELGPGEAIKSKLLINQFLKDQQHFTYFPIDISKTYLTAMVQQFNKDMPLLPLTALQADYFSGLKWVTQHVSGHNLVLFLGSSIGNFNHKDMHFFLRSVWEDLHDGDYFFIGFDLKKEIKTLLRAYQDTLGLTKQFNLNILERINRELGGTFNTEAFEHYPTYNVHTGAMESYLISLLQQQITISNLGKIIQFKAYEPLHLEFSYKYDIAQIEKYAQQNGFHIVEHFFDKKKYFVDSLWQVIKKN